MPKLKTYKAAVKCFKMTGMAKIRRHKEGVANADRKRVHRMLKR